MILFYTTLFVHKEMNYSTLNITIGRQDDGNDDDDEESDDS